MSKFENINNLFKHPVLILIIGSIISSFLLPKILSEVEKKESIRKQRLGLALKFIDKNTEINQEFNSLITSLELFHKYSTSQSSAKEQQQLRIKSKELYIQFNKNVWWWHWNLYEEAKTWDLIREDDDLYVKNALESYSRSWDQVLASLPPFWDACLSPSYKARDTTVTRLMIDARTDFNKSVAIRDTALRFLVSRLDVTL